MTGGSPEYEVVAVLEQDPDLGAGVSTSELLLARHQAIARVLVLGAGEREIPQLDAGTPQGWLGLFLVEGMVLRRVRIGRRGAGELFGPGDLLRPWDDDDDYGPLPVAVEWCVLARTRLAMLDASFARRIARWPQIIAALTGRVAQRARVLSLMATLRHLPRAGDRLLILFWLLCERWGTYTPHGARLTLPVTHDILASLICTERPTVTLALQRLARSGLVVREGGNRWLLTNDAIESLSSPENVELIAGTPA